MLACCFGSACAGPNPAAPRPTVTFILGEDHYAVNPYYANALAYYRQNTQSQAGYLVTNCRSLLEVCDYLQQQSPEGRPWGRVNLVAHGNPWTGMDLPIQPGDSSRTSTATLLAGRAAGVLKPLPRQVLDERSEVHLHGCALGLDTLLLQTLSKTLGNAQVLSTPFFNQYEPVNGQMQQSLAEFWHISYPTYQRPPVEKRAQQLAAKYPEMDIDWADALSRRRPRWPGDSYWKPVVVPVHWAATYPGNAEIPDLKTPEARQNWLAAQPELLAAIAELGLPLEQFRWNFHREILTFEDGAVEPAVVAEGQTTVCCVLRGVVESKPVHQSILAHTE